MADDHAKVLNLFTLELAFLRAEVQIMLLESSEDFFDDPSVFLQSRSEDQDVI